MSPAAPSRSALPVAAHQLSRSWATAGFSSRLPSCGGVLLERPVEAGCPESRLLPQAVRCRAVIFGLANAGISCGGTESGCNLPIASCDAMHGRLVGCRRE